MWWGVSFLYKTLFRFLNDTYYEQSSNMTEGQIPLLIHVQISNLSWEFVSRADWILVLSPPIKQRLPGLEEVGIIVETGVDGFTEHVLKDYSDIIGHSSFSFTWLLNQNAELLLHVYSFILALQGAQGNGESRFLKKSEIDMALALKDSILWLRNQEIKLIDSGSIINANRSRVIVPKEDVSDSHKEKLHREGEIEARLWSIGCIVMQGKWTKTLKESSR